MVLQATEPPHYSGAGGFEPDPLEPGLRRLMGVQTAHFGFDLTAESFLQDHVRIFD